jgi:hypothetical protein
MGIGHWALDLKTVGSVWSCEDEAGGLVRKMDDFGGYSRLKCPLTGRARSW